MTVPRIGLTTYARDENNWFRLPAEYVDSVRRAGGLPVLLPPGEPGLEHWLAGIDGLILTGGGDLHPETHGGAEHPTVHSVDRDRDRDEIELARHLAQSGMPGLCICRGMQVLNVALGGTLITHLPDVTEATPAAVEIAHRSAERKPVPHDVDVEASTELAKIMGRTSVRTSSWHHQAIDEIAPGLRVVARAPDGVIEAVELPDRPALVAVQWHPELTSAEDPSQQRLFDAVVQAARARLTQ